MTCFLQNVCPMMCHGRLAAGHIDSINSLLTNIFTRI